MPRTKIKMLCVSKKIIAPIIEPIVSQRKQISKVALGDRIAS